MKQILAITLYYLNRHGSMIWARRVGLALWVLAIAGSLLSKQDSTRYQVQPINLAAIYGRK